MKVCEIFVAIIWEVRTKGMVVCEHKTLACDLTENNRRDDSKSLIEEIDKTKTNEDIFEVVLVSLLYRPTTFSLSFTVYHLDKYSINYAIFHGLRIFLFKACL